MLVGREELDFARDVFETCLSEQLSVVIDEIQLVEE